MDVKEYAAQKLWQSYNPNAVYNHGFGIETAWRQNWKTWGFPIEDGEAQVQVNGVNRIGRTFTKAGFVYWHPANGATVVDIG